MANGLAGAVEQLINRILQPLDMVVISRERIQQTLDEAAQRGRMTRGDANELVAELLRCGRQQTEELASDAERLIESGRTQLDFAHQRARQSEPLEQAVRVTDGARQSVAAGASFPISGYDDMTASQVNKRLADLSRPQLRTIHEYESRHANRKSVLEAIDTALR